MKEEENNTIYGNTDESGACHTEWSKSDRERQIHEIAYTWNLKKWFKWTYLQNRNTVKIKQRQTYGYQGESGVIM